MEPKLPPRSEPVKVPPALRSVWARAALSAIVVAGLTAAAGVIVSMQTSQPLSTPALLLLLGSGAVVGGILGALVSLNTDALPARTSSDAGDSGTAASRAARGGPVPDNPDVRAAVLKVARDQLAHGRRGLRRAMALPLGMAAFWMWLGVADGVGHHWDSAAWKLTAAALYVVLALYPVRETRRLARRVALLQGDSSWQPAKTM
jgi:hypothetical protein